MAEVLWLEPSREGNLPPTSLFFSSGHFVLSTFTLGSFDPARREKAYHRISQALLNRAIQLSVGDVRVKHTRLSRQVVGTRFPPYSLSRPPSDLSLLSSFADILVEQKALSRKLEDVDIRKLVFQAVYGPAHLLSSSQSPLNDLLKEWESADDRNTEPFAERISPEGDLYRVNLRPAKELGIDPGELFKAIERTAENIAGQRARRERELLTQARSVGIEPQEINKGPFHHSRTYKNRTKPAYRLVDSVQIAGLLQGEH